MSVDAGDGRANVCNIRVKVATLSVIVGKVSVIVSKVSLIVASVSVIVGNVRVNGGNVSAEVGNMGVEVRYVSVVFASWRSPTDEFGSSSGNCDASTDDCFAHCSYVVPPPANMDAVTVKRNWRCAPRGQRGGRIG